MRRRAFLALPVCLAPAVLFAFAFRAPQPGGQVASPTANDPLSRAFATGWMLQDTNGDGLADTITGKVVVPAQPSAVDNAAAANLAARLAYGSTGLTPPLVVTSADAPGVGPRFYVGAGSLGGADAAQATAWKARLAAGEGAVVALGPNLALLGADDAGEQAAAEEFSARAPYQWQVSGNNPAALGAIATAVNAAATGAGAQLVGVSYAKGKSGIQTAFLRAGGSVAAAQLGSAIANLPAVHRLTVLAATPVSATNPKAFTPPAPAAAGEEEAGAAAPAAAAGRGAAGAAAGRGGRAGGGGGGVSGFDLASLYGGRNGLFNAASPAPVAGSLNAHLYAPAGAAGTAMANLAARMGMETTGITLPVASPATDADLQRISTQPVAAGSNPLVQSLEDKLKSGDTAAAQADPSLAPGEGELRIVDRAFGARGGLLVRGDAAGQAAALEFASDHLPNLWEAGKQYASLEDVRYDLHQFFSLHSGVGQAAAGLFFLQQWMKDIGAAPVTDVKVEMYTDLADPKLGDFISQQVQSALHTTPQVTAASLRAGTQCCDANPDLHYKNPDYPYHHGTPVFVDDKTFPWEGQTLLDKVRGARIAPGQPVTIVARVSEGPEERQKLAGQIEGLLTAAEVPQGQAKVEVLSAHKQGYSWLVDDVVPALNGMPVSKLEIDFAKDIDETGIRVMYSPARWGQELYPVDEVLADKLKIPLKNISISEIDTAPKPPTPVQIAIADPPQVAPSPTYAAHAFDAAGKEIFHRDFTVATTNRPYFGQIPAYETVQVETGWVNITQNGSNVLDERIPTDLEEVWDHYQNVDLPQAYRFVMAQSKGNLRRENVPAFDTMKMDFHLSEPDYNIGIDKERISAIEAFQEDIFYTTETFFDTVGNLESGGALTYVGRIIPVVHPSEDGHAPSLHIEFYGKAAAGPKVTLSWTDAAGKTHEEERDLPVVTGDFQPRLVAARVKAGTPGIENLVWELPADFKNYDMTNWIKTQGREQLERSVFTVAQAQAELHWLDAMHAADVYSDEVAYSHVEHMGLELALPRPMSVAFTTPEEKAYVGWNVTAPAHPRPMITDYPALTRTSLVQWEEPIPPAESASILATLAKDDPGVNVYWMGRTYLGENIWAADVMLPTPSTLRSWGKETTLKASIVYSARQHANEPSSTSHVLRLGDMLLHDAATRTDLKQVNVVLHPITNPDGAQLSVDLARITPDNVLHPGYHGALAADVSTGQGDIDPLYPESRTRRLLLEQWNPDAFLNPHGYPSHEWVQPFSEYSAWVQSRTGANGGRTWWIPRGWFTTLGYTRDTTTQTYSEEVAYAIRDRIVASERQVPGLLDLETRMNDRYARWGQAFQPDNMQQPVVDGIRIYMPIKGSTGAGGGGQAGAGASATITWDQGYTEAPDETAHGEYMHLMASAGLAWDKVHLDYLAQGRLRINRTQTESASGVAWSVTRQRPILPSTLPAVPKPSGGQ